MTARTRFSIVMTWLMAVVLGCAANSACAQSAAPPAAQTPAQRLRIGVYSSRGVAIAFLRSGGLAKQLQDMQRQLKEAEAANDTKKADEIKARGANMQTIAHMQGFSNAPVDDALETIKDKLPAIAKDAGVNVIVATMDYQGPDVQIIDVTDKIVAEFKPDDRTLTIIAAMKNQKPITLLEALSIKD